MLVKHNKKWYFFLHLLVIILALFLEGIIKVALREKAKNQRREREKSRCIESVHLIFGEKKNLERGTRQNMRLYMFAKYGAYRTKMERRAIFITFLFFRVQKKYRVTFAFGDTNISRHHALLSITQIFGNDKCFKNITPRWHTIQSCAFENLNWLQTASQNNKSELKICKECIKSIYCG